MAKSCLATSRKTSKTTKEKKPWYDHTCRQLKKQLQQLVKKINPQFSPITTTRQGRSQDFSVGTHSFPSHLFTPPPPPKKKKMIKVIFDSRVFYFKYININIFEIYFFYFIYLFIYFLLLLLFSGTQLRICVQVATPLQDCLFFKRNAKSMSK